MAISAAALTRLSPDAYGAQRNKVSAFAGKTPTVSGPVIFIPTLRPRRGR